MAMRHVPPDMMCQEMLASDMQTAIWAAML